MKEPVLVIFVPFALVFLQQAHGQDTCTNLKGDKWCSEVNAVCRHCSSADQKQDLCKDLFCPNCTFAGWCDDYCGFCNHTMITTTASITTTSVATTTIDMTMTTTTEAVTTTTTTEAATTTSDWVQQLCYKAPDAVDFCDTDLVRSECSTLFCDTCQHAGYCDTTCGVCSSPPDDEICDDFIDECENITMDDPNSCDEQFCPTCPLAGHCDFTCSICNTTTITTTTITTTVTTTTTTTTSATSSTTTRTTTTTVCLDNEDFLDENNFTCDAWDGFECRDYDGYSEEATADIRRHCPAACGLCQALTNETTTTETIMPPSSLAAPGSNTHAASSAFVAYVLLGLIGFCLLTWLLSHLAHHYLHPESTKSPPVQPKVIDNAVLPLPSESEVEPSGKLGDGADKPDVDDDLAEVDDLAEETTGEPEDVTKDVEVALGGSALEETSNDEAVFVGVERRSSRVVSSTGSPSSLHRSSPNDRYRRGQEATVLATCEDRWPIFCGTQGHQCSEAAEEAQKDNLDGIWSPTNSPEYRIAIFGNTIRWPDGNYYHFTFQAGIVEAQICDSLKRGNIVNGHIKWEDGEVWVTSPGRRLELQMDNPRQAARPRTQPTAVGAASGTVVP